MCSNHLLMVICFLEFCFGGRLTRLAAKQGNLLYLIYSTSLCRCVAATCSFITQQCKVARLCELKKKPSFQNSLFKLGVLFGWNVRSWEGLYTTAQGLHELHWLCVPGEAKKTGKGASQEAYLREGPQTSLLPLGLFPNSQAKKEKPGLGKINNLHCTIRDVSGWFVTFSNTVCHEQH